MIRRARAPHDLGPGGRAPRGGGTGWGTWGAAGARGRAPAAGGKCQTPLTRSAPAAPFLPAYFLTLLMSEILRIGCMIDSTMKPTTAAMNTIRMGSSRLVTFSVVTSTSSS